jgi:NAD(P)H-hydrate epimerase
MKKIVTPEQMAAADRSVIDAGTPSLVLMERAGWAVARAATRLAGGSYGRRVLVVCGKGNNAGDGLVAARYLSGWGAYPVIVLLDEPDAIGGDAGENLKRLGGVRIGRYDAVWFSRQLARTSIVVDAIVGTGFQGTLRGAAAEVVEGINGAGAPVVSVDIPSGVEGATGRVSGPAVVADITVTMGAPKVGLILHPGSEYAGEIEIADIGVPDEKIDSNLWLIEEPDVRRALPARNRTAHKRSVGTALVIAGSVGMSGAAALAAEGALRAGAGLVTIAAPASVALQLDQTVIEATTLPLPETGRGTIEASALGAILERASSVDAVAVGPGLTTDPETVEFVRKLAGAIERPLVIDADAMNALNPEMVAAREFPTLLTPHPGELSRFLAISAEEIAGDRIGAAIRTARQAGAAVLLKGYRTIVASPNGEAAVITTGGPVLATGGTGDVLTGCAVAFLAAGLDSFTAGWCAGWIHGRAGDVLADRVGERAVVAGDLLTILPEVMHSLEE